MTTRNHTSPHLHLAVLPIKSREGSGEQGSVLDKAPCTTGDEHPRSHLPPWQQSREARSCLVPSSHALLTGHHCAAFLSTINKQRHKHYC